MALAELVQRPDLFAGAAHVEAWFERGSNPGSGFFWRLAKNRKQKPHDVDPCVLDPPVLELRLVSVPLKRRDLLLGV